jgi:hypothetical protein
VSYYGEGTMCRRADVLRAEANELAACMLTLTTLLTRPPHPCGHRTIEAGCGGARASRSGRSGWR